MRGRINCGEGFDAALDVVYVEVFGGKFGEPGAENWRSESFGPEDGVVLVECIGFGLVADVSFVRGYV